MPKTWKSELFEWGKAFALAVILALVIRMFLVEVYVVDGHSMQPTLLHEERVLVNKFTYRIAEPSSLDVIVFRYPKEPWRDFIKRIVAVEGQTVEVREGKVFVNGQALDEPYLQSPTHGVFGPEVVPEGTVFVMGDNRNFSLDSRDVSVGFVPLGNVKGKAMGVFWPLAALRLMRH
ncbi:MAG: signal peptidase I [Peptococcaceae bacterium]|nr:signal peptidase I [Peptococcaceae bacterium]MBT9158024.1 Signal peptidase I P [Bacillota bacterium]